jgi:hypothetical protein
MSGAKTSRPWTPNWDDGTVGTRAQANYKFIVELWRDNSLRTSLLRKAEEDQNDLRRELNERLQLKIDDYVNILVIDLGTGTMKPEKLPPGEFYSLLLPANPTRMPDNPPYKYNQAWTEAWYHAVREAGGM